MFDRSFFSWHRPWVWALVAIVLVGIGCNRDEEIVRHRIPKSRSGLEALRIPASKATDQPPQAASDRMVVGLFEQPEATWFFKINGSSEQLKKTEPQWKPFLESITFANGQPQWELPTGWQTGAAREMRLATLIIGESDPPLELAISSLGPNQDRLLNVNRWRVQQMGLPEISADELEANLPKMESAKTPAFLFDVVGKSSGGMIAPFANRPLANRPNENQPGVEQPDSSQPSPNPTTPPRTAGSDPTTNSDPSVDSKPKTDSAPATDVSFDIPADWVSGETSIMVPVRLKKKVGDKEAQITIVQMPADANEWEPIVKRWAGDVGLSGLSADEIKSRTIAVTVDGIEGQLIRLVADEAETGNATIAGMVKQQNTAWFLKLTGDQAVVIESEKTFSTFLASLKFPAAQ